MSDPPPDHSTLSVFRSRRSRIEAANEPDGPESKEKRCKRMEEVPFRQASRKRLVPAWV